MFMRLDKYIIKRLQEIYNFLWDHYGFTKGAVQVAFLAAIMFLLISRLDVKDYVQWGALVVNSMMAYICMNNHDKQAKGQFNTLNKQAALNTDSAFMLFLRLPIPLGLAFGSLSRLDAGFLVFVFISIVFYFDCLYVKDRNIVENFDHAHSQV